MKFELSKDMDKDFRELKEEVTAGKIQGYQGFDSTEPFILTTDWSALNIAAILSQKKRSGTFVGGRSATNSRNTIHLGNTIHLRNTIHLGNIIHL